jgi:cell division protein FtsL
MATDKIFILFIFLIVVGIVTAIAINFVHPKAGQIQQKADDLIRNIVQGATAPTPAP